MQKRLGQDIEKTIKDLAEAIETMLIRQELSETSRTSLSNAIRSIHAMGYAEGYSEGQKEEQRRISFLKDCE